MSRLGKLMSFFPLALASTIGLAALLLVHSPSLASLALFLFCLYGLAPLCFRIHELFFKLQDGATDISSPRYSPWWGSHQIQLLYIALPGVEAALRLIPGAYSAWLRLWGARIGRGVYWTPRVEILDRSRLTIGDRVVFGHLSILCSHVITPGRKKTILLVKSIRIGNGAFIGAGSRLGPGCEIQDGAVVGYNEEVGINEIRRAG